MVLLRKNIPQNHNLQAAAELGVMLAHESSIANFEGTQHLFAVMAVLELGLIKYLSNV